MGVGSYVIRGNDNTPDDTSPIEKKERYPDFLVVLPGIYNELTQQVKITVNLFSFV